MIDFPASPTLNQVYSFGDYTWQWNGSGWKKIQSSNNNTSFLQFLTNVGYYYESKGIAFVEFDTI